MQGLVIRVDAFWGPLMARIFGDTGGVEVGGLGSGRSGEPDADFVARINAAFIREVYQPLLQRAALYPDDVRPVVARIHDGLAILDQAIEYSDGAEAAPERPPAAAVAASPAPLPPRHGSDIGRNQRSRLRELAVLEFIEKCNRACALAEIMTVLHAQGFGDTSAAVVSQMHRLKALGVIEQPGNGMYAITDPGLGHLRKLRTGFGDLR